METRKELARAQVMEVLRDCTEIKIKQCLDFAPDGQWQDATPEKVVSKIEPKSWLSSGHHVAKFKWNGDVWVLTLVEYIGGNFIPYLVMNKA